MKEALKKISLALVSVVLLAAIGMPGVANAQLFDGAKEQACEGLNAGGGTNNCDPNAGNNVTGLISTAINLISIAVGIIAVIMIIISGLKYITSQGDSNSVNSAKNTLLYAVVGLVIAFLAQFIVRFVLQKV